MGRRSAKGGGGGRGGGGGHRGGRGGGGGGSRGGGGRGGGSRQGGTNGGGSGGQNRKGKKHDRRWVVEARQEARKERGALRSGALSGMAAGTRPDNNAPRQGSGGIKIWPQTPRLVTGRSVAVPDWRQGGRRRKQERRAIVEARKEGEEEGEEEGGVERRWAEVGGVQGGGVQGGKIANWQIANKTGSGGGFAAHRRIRGFGTNGDQAAFENIAERAAKCGLGELGFHDVAGAIAHGGELLGGCLDDLADDLLGAVDVAVGDVPPDGLFGWLVLLAALAGDEVAHVAGIGGEKNDGSRDGHRAVDLAGVDGADGLVPDGDEMGIRGREREAELAQGLIGERKHVRE